MKYDILKFYSIRSSKTHFFDYYRVSGKPTSKVYMCKFKFCM